MGIAIALRNSQDKSYYKEMIIGLMGKVEGLADEVVLGSGFYQQDETKYGVITGNKFPRVEETNIAGLSLLDCINNYQYMWTLIGMHGDGDKKSFLNSYKEFIDIVRKKRSVEAYLHKDRKWHAKVFLLLNNKQPIIGIVGSSNMTRPAFGTYGNDFNMEADVLIWDSAYERDIAAFLNSIDESKHIIRAVYNVDENNGRTEKDRLADIYAAILQEINDDTKFEKI